MKTFIQLAVVLFLAILGYAAYGFFSFKPDDNAPFTFNEPILPPEIAAELAQQDAPLSSADQSAQQRAIDEAQKAFAIYSRYESSSGDEVKDSVSVLHSRMLNWELPSYFLSSLNSSGMRSFETLRLVVDNILPPNTASDKPLNCTDKTPMAGVIVGSTGKDILRCDTERLAVTDTQDLIFIGGPDDDSITDVAGNRIINAGTGNDTLVLGKGRSIIILDSAWGQDSVTIDCSDAKIDATQIPAGFPIPWAASYANFIVLGTGVDANSVSWKDNVLTDSLSGSTLTVNEKCFTVAPAL